VSWLSANLDLIWSLTLEHLRLAVLPIVLGFAISVPLGYLAYRYRVARGPLLTVTGLLYTIPSLALLVMLPVVTGISPLSEINLVIALTVYAVALMTRSVADALESVDPDVRQAATALGYSSWRRFWAVEFPLAGPVMLAGLRVVAVSTIALVTVGILVGVPSLGYLFTNGFQRRIIEEVLAGVVMTMLLALLVDFVLSLFGRGVMPWTRGPRRARRGVRPEEGRP
jgi:osmoprotectant transport system permease protein